MFTPNKKYHEAHSKHLRREIEAHIVEICEILEVLCDAFESYITNLSTSKNNKKECETIVFIIATERSQGRWCGDMEGA